MENLIPEALKLIGLSVDEEFRIKGTCWIHKFDIDGNSKARLLDDDRNYQDSNYFLKEILNGTYEIEKLPFKPKPLQEFWYVNSDGRAICCVWSNFIVDWSLYKLGNCFRTKEEAEANADRIRKEIMG